MERKTVLLRPRRPYVPWKFLKETGDIRYWETGETLDIVEYCRLLKTLRPHGIVGTIPRITGDMMDLDERLE